jgi:inosine/guanosine/xanthosine phosphorylase family protein
VSRLDDFGPRIGVVLGSGLGAVADLVQDADVVPYDELAGFPPAGVAGHAGRALLGTIAGARVAVLQGRAHVYEGHAPEVVAGPMRALASAGAELVLLTNAAGSLRPEVGPGSLMAITDHINLMGFNPLVGPHFVPMGAAYDPALRALLDVEHEGVYLAVRGPSFETPAEIRAFRTLGADAVGMSTVPEVIVARHAGMRVAAVSAITNLAEGLADQSPSHEQTLRDAARAAGDLARVVEGFCARA